MPTTSSHPNAGAGADGLSRRTGKRTDTPSDGTVSSRNGSPAEQQPPPRTPDEDGTATPLPLAWPSAMKGSRSRGNSLSSTTSTGSYGGGGTGTGTGGGNKRVTYALLRWNDLPAWRRDNVYIRSGYRPTSHSYVASLGSVLGVHNESVNVWTHLGGAVVAAVLGAALHAERGRAVAAAAVHALDGVLAGLPGLPVLSLLPAPVRTRLQAVLVRFTPQLATWTGGWTPVPVSSSSSPSPSPEAASALVLSCFAAGAVACLGMSATYHALTNHSPAVARWGNKLDYTGIVLLIVGSYVPTLYYALFCHPFWLAFYLGLIALLGLACLVASWLEHFRTPAWRPYRALLFVGLGLCAVIPVLHTLLLLEHGASLAVRYHQLNNRMGLNWVFLQGFLYIFGALVYATRCPERWYPGRFDIWGSSHQIFHVFVLIAAAAHLRGVMQAHTYHHHVMGAACPAPPLG